MLKGTLLAATMVLCALLVTPAHAQMSAEMKTPTGLFEFDVSARMPDGNDDIMVNLLATHGRTRTTMSDRNDWQALRHCAIYCDQAANNFPSKNDTGQHARSIIDRGNTLKKPTSTGIRIPVGCRCGIGGY